jgi:hypothetical protein
MLGNIGTAALPPPFRSGPSVVSFDSYEASDAPTGPGP